MIPKLETVNLKKRGKLFSLIVDFNTKSDTTQVYPKSWGLSFWDIFNQLQQEE